MANILEYFEKTSLKYRDKTAISMRGDKLTFSQLRFMSRCLGAEILNYCGSGHPIGVFANRRVNTAVSFLAVLYSENFYVPLDPDMPKDKLVSIINDAGLGVIVGESENEKILDELHFSGKFFANGVKSSDAEKCCVKEGGERRPLYMIYTSGSTGKPKGVLKSHESMISFIDSFCETFGVSSDEVIGNQTPFFFDASAKDFYLMLKTGATLEIIPTELFALPTMLIEYLNEKKITFASWVPSAISIVARLNPFSLVKPEYLKRLFFVGEAMPMKHLNKWREALPDVKYINLYGQSEISGICCFYEITPEISELEAIPIGKPLKNCRVYLYDGDSQRPILEAGQIGEIFISGPALADGYYNDPEKTADSFFEIDFGNGPIRCFKTGDMAKYDNEGNLVFAARRDFQIKHMGHRIELGEIESKADMMPGIVRCCCLYDQEGKKIVLFCEPERNTNLSKDDVRRFLKEKLSSYMVPAKIIPMESLPINANGKTDRNALKALL